MAQDDIELDPVSMQANESFLALVVYQRCREQFHIGNEHTVNCQLRFHLGVFK